MKREAVRAKFVVRQVVPGDGVGARRDKKLSTKWRPENHGNTHRWAPVRQWERDYHGGACRQITDHRSQ